jgi:hypothetical protein
LEYWQKSLGIRIRVSDQDSLLVAQTQEGMANMYADQGKHDQALDIYKSVLETRILLCGQDFPGVAMSKVTSVIGLVFKDMGKKSEAKQMFIEAAGIRRKVLGADHPLTKESAIGCRVTVECKYKQVVLLNTEIKFQHHDRTLDTYHIHGQSQEHPNVAATYQNLAVP